MNRLWQMIAALGAVVLLGYFLIFFDSSERVTRLMIAAKSGNEIEVSQLIAEGVDIDAKSKFDWTALMFAAWQGEAEIVNLLLDAGADANSDSRPVAASFETTSGHPSSNALSEAIRNGHLDIVINMIDRGVQIDASSMALAGKFGDTQLLERMIKNGGKINQLGNDVWNPTALSNASRVGNLQNIEWLILDGADPNLTMPRSTNLSSAAAEYHTKAVALLIDLGANPNQEYGTDSETVLWQTITRIARSGLHGERLEIVEILLKNGSDPNYLFRGKTMIAHIENSIERRERDAIDPTNEEYVQYNHELSAGRERKILNLLKAHKP